MVIKSKQLGRVITSPVLQVQLRVSWCQVSVSTFTNNPPQFPDKERLSNHSSWERQTDTATDRESERESERERELKCVSVCIREIQGFIFGPFSSILPSNFYCKCPGVFYTMEVVFPCYFYLSVTALTHHSPLPCSHSGQPQQFESGRKLSLSWTQVSTNHSASRFVSGSLAANSWLN